MEKIQVFLREEQRDQLRKIAARTGQRQSVLIRRGVDLMIEETRDSARQWHSALQAIKGIWSDRDDLDIHSQNFKEQFSRRFKQNH